MLNALMVTLLIGAALLFSVVSFYFVYRLVNAPSQGSE